MADRRDNEERLFRDGDPSDRAARMTADEDAPVSPGDTDDTDRPHVRGLPPAVPVAAAPNQTVNTSAGTAGGPGPQGAAAAAAMVAGEEAFGQDDFRTGWDVFTADDSRLGTVTEVGPERILVSRVDRDGQVYIPYTGVGSASKGRVQLNVAADMLDRQDWQQVLPGGPPLGNPAPPAKPVAPEVPPVNRVDETRTYSHTEPTSSVVREETTVHRVPPASVHAIETHTEEPKMYVPPPRTFPKEDTAGPIDRAKAAMSNVRESVKEATREPLIGKAPKDTFADTLSFLENIPNSFYYLATVVSVVSSLVLFLSGKRWESLFVGLWAPTIVSASMFYKLLRPSQEVRRM